MKLTVFIISILLSFSVYSQSVKYSNEFLSLGISARGLGMASSVTTSTHDANAGYWNPAGLSLMSSDMDIAAMHAEYFAGVGKYDFIGAAFKNNDKVFGVSIIRFAVDDIPNTLELIDSENNFRYDRIKSFSVSDLALLASYSQKSPWENLYFGGNAKIIRRLTGDFASAWGFGVDLSALYVLNKWKFSVVGRDITGTFNAWNFNTNELKEVFLLTGNDLPKNGFETTLPKIILGASYRHVFSEKYGILAEINTDITTDGKRNVLVKSNFMSIDPKIGIEADYKKLLFLRFGLGNIQKVKNFESEDLYLQPSIGLGFCFKNLSIDYAFTDIANSSSNSFYTHVVSLKYSIIKNK